MQEVNAPIADALQNDDVYATEVFEFDTVDGNKATAAAYQDDSQEDENTEGGCLSAVIRYLKVVIPYGGMVASGANIISTTVGAGILGLPAAFNDVGIIMAVAYLTFITAASIYSMYLLVEVSDRTGLRSYEEMGKYLLHPRGDIIVAILRAVYGMGGLVAYVVTIGDLIRPILSSLSSTPHFLLTDTGIKLLSAGFWFVFMFPLVLPRKINSLRYVSAFSILFVLFFIFVVIAHSAMHGMRANPRPHTVMFNTGNIAIEGLGVFVFSFTSQLTTIEVAREMRPRSVERFNLCATVSMVICALLYFFTGLFGYLDFGVVEGSILLKYDPLKQPQIFVSYVGIFMKICASFGVVNNACRSALFPLLGWDPYTVVYWKYLIGAIFLAVVALVLGLLVPNVNLVFGFVGGVCGGLMGFVLPALFFMYSGGWTFRRVGAIHYCSTYILLFTGVVAIVFGTCSTIYSAIAG